MNLNSYYLYAFANQNSKPYDGDSTLKVLKEILESGKIKSRRLRGDTDTTKGGFNGIDYISLCDFRRRNNKPYENDPYLIGYNSYECFIKESPSFILKKNKIAAIKPILVEPVIFDYGSRARMCKLGNATYGRFSDLPDEVQVKNEISLDRCVGLTIPIEYMTNEHKEDIFSGKTNKEIYSRGPYTLEELIIYVKELKNLLEAYNISSKVYDLESQIELDSEDVTQKVYTMTKNK